MNNLPIRLEHLRLTQMRGEDTTYCPSEVARNLFPDNWRTKMDLVRDIADQLIEDERKLDVLQKGSLISSKASSFLSPFRLRIKLKKA